jgi:hypothetical protein
LIRSTRYWDIVPDVLSQIVVMILLLPLISASDWRRPIYLIDYEVEIRRIERLKAEARQRPKQEAAPAPAPAPHGRFHDAILDAFACSGPLSDRGMTIFLMTQIVSSSIPWPAKGHTRHRQVATAMEQMLRNGLLSVSRGRYRRTK